MAKILLFCVVACGLTLPSEGADSHAPIDYVDALIGTEGEGTQYGGMMPYVGVPFGSFHLVPMTRLNGVGRLSYNQADDSLIGFNLTRQPAIWMGDWGAVRIPLTPRKIEGLDSTPYCGKMRVAGRVYEYTATAHAAWLRGDFSGVWLPSGYDANRDDAGLGYPLPNFRGWRYVLQHPGECELKIGVSLISLEQAKANLEREIGTQTFEEVVSGVRRQWEQYFSRIDIDAPEDVKRIFYTGVFHTLLYPRQIGEYGRYYSAFDDKIHSGDMYTCFSLWDTYRAEHPWLTLIAPERVDAMMQSLLEMYKEGGWLPKWPNPSYTGIMIGAPAEIVLAEACAKGFSGFDIGLAYEAVYKNAMQPQKNDASFVWEDRGMFGRTPETRGGLGSYMRRGYVACDETAESVSRTQDFCFDDRAAAVLAEASGHSDDAEMFRRRSCNYTNLWNSATSSFRPRRADGRFDSPSTEIKGVHGWGHGAYCEQTEKTAVWGIPFDTDGLVRLLGGKAEAVRRLDDFFDGEFWKAERGNRSIHGNEPSHHCAYLYNRFGAAEKTQLRVRQILARSYSSGRRGFDGNEDCGQMSAWYIMSALGFYPIDPTTGEYEIGSPLVRSATLRFATPYPRATLRIVVKNYSPSRWRVKRACLNGLELKEWHVRHADLVKGGELVFEMAD